MKFKLQSVLLKISVAALLTPVMAQANLRPNGLLDDSNGSLKMAVPLTNIFMPLGFDQNDNAEVVVSGHLPNLCFQNLSSRAKVNTETREITIDVVAEYKVPTHGVCLDINIPFLETVQLGELPAGDYKLVANKGDRGGVEGKNHLSISQSHSTSIDDFLYAKVTNVTPLSLNPFKIKLEGIHYSSCQRLKEVRFFSNHVDTYAVLPIMEKFSDDCRAIHEPFSQEIDVPNELGQEGVLLHVRTLGGKAVNVPIGVVF
jgi:hypothetical protein